MRDAASPQPAIASTKSPRLTKPEMARLMEIQHITGRQRLTSCLKQPKSTASLIAKGLVRAMGGSAETVTRGKIHPHAVLTEAGRAVLAGLPVEG